MIRVYKYYSTAFFISILCATSLVGQAFSNEKGFLPTPTGPYTIGTTSFFLKDSLQKNGLFAKEDYKRLHVKIWYPSDSLVSYNERNRYLSGYDLDDIYSLFKKKGIVKQDVIDIATNHTFSKDNLPVSDSKEAYPLIIFTPGYYFGLSDIYSSFAENLASNGYIVCSIIHVHEQICIEDEQQGNTKLKKAKSALPFFQWWLADLTCFRDANKAKNQERLTRYYLRRLKRFDRKIESWEASSLYLIDYLKEQKIKTENALYTKIDFDNIGTFGQSLGGALSNHLCVANDVIKAGASMDCIQFGDVVDSGSDKPLLLIESDHQKKWKIGNEYIYRDINQLEYLRIKGALHFLFCDLPYYDVTIGRESVKNFIGDVDGESAINVINSTVLNFFNHHLKGNESSLAEEKIDDDMYLYQISNKCIYLK
ncbi:hypothetical protein J1N10_00090 [Carboxylicivirga sp. A043]|uniref:alpha/beta hydrolase n=1 Tax=Carboxylicivirga litoralis TaxID=2816963 RepID=UPI0021CB4C4B|nr:hypothetical protein [Carboxylicivirga sp. A043]MCU4154358.1 hypothetical protein [Carboxylicivirga sp. A043]